MTILYFAQIRKVTACEIENVEIQDSITGHDLWTLLEKRHPGLAAYKASTRIARNCEYVGDEILLQDGDEVALIPPVSGG